MSNIAIIGGGPTGLIAAEHLAGKGHAVTLYDRMPSVGRKFLLAGRGGLNLTHSEPLESFLGRYGAAQAQLAPFLRAHDAVALRNWCHALGEETFVGSSGRVFPQSFKASPLLRLWLRRLESLGVTLKPRHHWQGWSETGCLRFMTPAGAVDVTSDGVLLALGGASWPRLGSDGGWVALLEAKGVDVAALQPANCGFEVAWSEFMQQRFAGTPLKRIAITVANRTLRGEAMLTVAGLEGGVIYALSSLIRDALPSGPVPIHLDLRPDLSLETLVEHFKRARSGESFANRLRKNLGLAPVAIALLHETDKQVRELAPQALAGLIKALPLLITGVRPIERAISTAGGIRFDALDDSLMLNALPGVFCAGEMLDWEAPTGGYLLQACFATGIAAAEGIHRYLEAQGAELSL